MLSLVATAALAHTSSRVQFAADGRLVYPADAQGNRIPDFSHAGYEGGGVPLPDVPVRVTVSPVDGDDTATIQAALDQVGALPLQADGYRGTVRLAPGIYDVAGTIRIRHSGVVLAGSGDGDDPAANTILRRTGTSLANVIMAGGGADDQFRSEIPGTRRPITSPRVGVGSRVFTVDDASGFAVGDNVIVFHPSTEAWIAAMDRGGVTDANVWRPGDIDIRYHRYVTAIAGNTIEIDAPVFDHLERSLSQSFVYKYDRAGVLTKIGIEDLQVDIVTAGPTSETHCEDAVEFIEAENSWIRDCTMKHFWHAGVQFAGSTRCTAERVRAIEPHSVVTGGRRYNFSTHHAQLILFRDCFAHDARHAYVANGTSTDAGNVALHCVLDRNYTFSEGHRRWSTGLLFDGLVATNRRNADTLGFYNRGNFGTGHGWAAGHSVIWNCDAAGGKILVQQPPLAQNYAIGSFGNVTGAGPFAGPVGFIEGSNSAGLEPNSLYLAQLNERQTRGLVSDLVAPSAPALTVGAVTATSVALSWTAAADNVAVAGYDVFRNGRFAGFTTGQNFTVGLLDSNTVHAFTVRARDAAGNSTGSNEATATTAPGAPVRPTLAFEAESLPFAAVNGSYSITFEDTASGGAFASPNISDPADPLFPLRRRYVTFGGDGNPPPPAGEYIDFVLPDIPAGTYNLVLRYKSHPTNRAIMRLAVDGQPLGGTLDQRTTPATFPSRDFGVVRFAADGDHVVRLEVTGKSNATGPWNVTADVITLVPDNTAPVISALADRTVEATGPGGAIVTYTGSATDAKDGAVPVFFDPPSGSTFPLGSSIVVALAQDFAGNLAGTSFTVNVVDTTPPSLSLPVAVTVEATSPAGAVVELPGSAFDLVDGDVGIAFTPATGTVFPLGDTTVTATATDDTENSATGSFVVSVRDSSAPEIRSLTPSLTQLWPANHQLVALSINAEVVDAVDPAPKVRVVSVTSSEPDNGQADGNTTNDAQITGNLAVALRAERSALGTGRIYTITVEAADGAGNTSTATTTVVVPHDLSG